MIESRLHHIRDVTMAEDQSQVRHPNAALVLGMVRRLVVSFALAWLKAVRPVKPRATARTLQKRFHHRDGGHARLEALLFAKSPSAWRLPR